MPLNAVHRRPYHHQDPRAAPPTILLDPITHGRREERIIEGDPIAFTLASTLHGFASLSADKAVTDVEKGLPEVVRHLLVGLAPR